MYDINAFFRVLDEYAPLEISKKMIEAGDYDNSGIIVKAHPGVGKVLFTLELSAKSVKRAVQAKCDTIVTHHPAIYYPVKNLDFENQDTAPLVVAVKNDLNVISMHLNLDSATCGIDHYLCQGLGGQKYKILFYTDEVYGYGREFEVDKPLGVLVKEIKKNFNTNKVLTYGKSGSLIKKVASFCGGGASHAQRAVAENLTDADLIVSSDMPHHVIKYLVEAGKNIVILPHYVAEEYGFKKFYESVTNTLKDVTTIYFDDKRFR